MLLHMQTKYEQTVTLLWSSTLISVRNAMEWHLFMSFRTKLASHHSSKTTSSQFALSFFSVSTSTLSGSVIIILEANTRRRRKKSNKSTRSENRCSKNYEISVHDVFRFSIDAHTHSCTEKILCPKQVNKYNNFSVAVAVVWGVVILIERWPNKSNLTFIWIDYIRPKCYVPTPHTDTHALTPKWIEWCVFFYYFIIWNHPFSTSWINAENTWFCVTWNGLRREYERKWREGKK